jgi:hypothetical protein
MSSTSPAATFAPAFSIDHGAFAMQITALHCLKRQRAAA